MRTQNLIDEQVSEFFRLNDIKQQIDIRIWFVDNPYDKCIELAADETSKKLFKHNGSFNNATVVPGKRLHDAFNIVISNKVFDYDDFTWKGTIHHELTHVYDIYNFAEYLDVEFMKEIYENLYYNCFIFWSEFHARRTGFMHIWNFFYNQSNYEEGKENAKSTFHQHIQHLNKSINTGDAIYEFMQFCGRYSALNDFYPDVFDDFDKVPPMISDEIEDQTLFSDTYKFLYSNLEFHQIKDNLRDLYGYFRKFQYR